MISAHGSSGDGSASMLVVILPVVAYALWVYLAAYGRLTDDVVRAVAAAGALIAALLHWAVAPEHLSVWWPAGMFFLAAGVAQLILTERLVRAPSLPVLLAGWLGSVGLVALWLWSRSVGLPIGPPGRERVGIVDTTCVVAELLTASLCAHLLRRSAPARPSLTSAK
jgi:hypothetical protein